MSEFRMPSLGADMESARLDEWTVKVGDHVKKGDIVAVVETDKGAIEVECFDEGVVEKLIVEPGTDVPVGEPMAIIRQAGEQAEAAESAAEGTAGIIRGSGDSAEGSLGRAPRNDKPVRSAGDSAVGSLGREPRNDGGGRADGILAVPGAKRLAAERSVDLRDVKGTGEGGAVTKADVERFLGAPGTDGIVRGSGDSAQGSLRREPRNDGAPADPQAAMRRAIAAAMAKSKREIPHYYLSDTVDLTDTIRWLEARNAEKPLKERLLLGVVFLKAVAMAAKRVPEMNGFWRADHFEPAKAVHAGPAISLRQGGLVAPAIHDTDTLPLGELMSKLSDLIKRTRSGGLRSSELTDATITVTSLGDLGVETVWGVIYPPQVAIVGFGAPVERPWAHGGEVALRKVVNMTLSADHRASDGMRGAKFLQFIKRFLTETAHLEEMG